MKQQTKPIGIFDSGYGGLTVLKEIVKELPQYDYLYLGDNARAPYGSRSFETVYEYTLQCVNYLFKQGCSLIIVACNTASAKALRTIQQKDLPLIAPQKRVLGVIRPTTEIIGNYTKTNCVGVLGTAGTISSGSYLVEIEKFFPNLKVYQEACPMWVPLIENNEIETINLFELKTSPNPASDKLTLSFNSGVDSDNNIVELIDIEGKTVYSTNYPIFKGINTFEISLVNIKNGVYIVKYTMSNGENYKSKFIKN